MGWFSKKEVKSGNLPELPELPEPGNATVPFNGSYQNLPAPPYPEISNNENMFTIEEAPKTQKITQEYAPEVDNNSFNMPLPGMQKLKLGPVGSTNGFVPQIKRPEIQAPPIENNNFQDKNIQRPRVVQQYNEDQQYPGQATQDQNIRSYEPPQMMNRQQGQFRPPLKNVASREKTQPVFIRLDKFESTIESFREIRNKIREIEDLLAKTREIKAREEKELEDWEREIEAIKLKIESIDKDMFEENQ